MLDTNRIKHSLGVAKTMKALANKHADYYNVDANDAFILGYLHDVGYEFINSGEDHALVGANYLKAAGYAYWAEVYFHGKPQTEYKSKNA